MTHLAPGTTHDRRQCPYQIPLRVISKLAPVLREQRPHRVQASFDVTVPSPHGAGKGEGSTNHGLHRGVAAIVEVACQVTNLECLHVAVGQHVQVLRVGRRSEWRARTELVRGECVCGTKHGGQTLRDSTGVVGQWALRGDVCAVILPGATQRAGDVARGPGRAPPQGSRRRSGSRAHRGDPIP